MAAFTNKKIVITDTPITEVGQRDLGLTQIDTKTTNLRNGTKTVYIYKKSLEDLNEFGELSRDKLKFDNTVSPTPQAIIIDEDQLSGLLGALGISDNKGGSGSKRTRKSKKSRKNRKSRSTK